MIKKYKAKLYPLYSIQFYRSSKAQKVISMYETSNIPDGTEPLADDLLNMKFHGMHIAESDLLTEGDKKAILAFCEGFINSFNLNRPSSSGETKYIRNDYKRYSRIFTRRRNWNIM